MSSYETDHSTRDRVRVYVTGTCDGLEDLREALGVHAEVDLVGWSNSVLEAASTLTGGHLQVVLHATRSSTLPADEIAAIREHTRAPVIVLTSGGSPSLLEDALAADVADVLLLPQLTENVVFALKKASHTGRRSLNGNGNARHGRVVTVFSPKGGTGKTVLSSNVSCSLAKHWGKRALLLDLDLQFGDAAIMLGIEPDKTIYDLVTAPGELDSEKLAGYTTRHASGLDILPAPLRPEDAELVTEAKLARLLEVARESYDVIVVDTSPFFHGPMLATLDRTDELLLLTSLDVPTIKNVRLALHPGAREVARDRSGGGEGAPPVPRRPGEELRRATWASTTGSRASTPVATAPWSSRSARSRRSASCRRSGPRPTPTRS